MNGLDHTLTKRVYKQNKIMQKKTLEYWLHESMVNEKNAKMRGKNARAYEKNPKGIKSGSNNMDETRKKWN